MHHRQNYFRLSLGADPSQISKKQSTIVWFSFSSFHSQRGTFILIKLHPYISGEDVISYSTFFHIVYVPDILPIIYTEAAYNPAASISLQIHEMPFEFPQHGRLGAC